MDIQFDAIYQRLYDQFVVRWFSYDEERGYNPVLVVRDALERAIALENVRLRSDARYFLLINFVEMIVRPLIRRDEGVIGRWEIEDDVEADLKTILRQAKTRPGPDELSGGEVLLAVAAQYSELRVARFRVWN